MSCFVIRGVAGDDRYVCGEGTRPAEISEDEGVAWRVLSRLPLPMFERFDWASGEIVADMDLVRSHMLAAIDAGRAAAGELHVTNGAGVQIAYQRKAEEAQRAVADSNTAIVTETAGLTSDYPFLAADAAMRSMSVRAVADEINAARERTDQALAIIEAKAAAAKALVRDASTIADAQAAADIDWSTL